VDTVENKGLRQNLRQNRCPKPCGCKTDLSKISTFGVVIHGKQAAKKEFSKRQGYPFLSIQSLKMSYPQIFFSTCMGKEKPHIVNFSILSEKKTVLPLVNDNWISGG